MEQVNRKKFEDSLRGDIYDEALDTLTRMGDACGNLSDQLSELKRGLPHDSSFDGAYEIIRMIGMALEEANKEMADEVVAIETMLLAKGGK